jgi:hypothetical protein
MNEFVNSNEIQVSSAGHNYESKIVRFICLLEAYFQLWILKFGILLIMW